VNISNANTVTVSLSWPQIRVLYVYLFVSIADLENLFINENYAVVAASVCDFALTYRY